MTAPAADKSKPQWRYYWLLMRPYNLGIIILTMALFMLHAAGWDFGQLRFPDALTVTLAVLAVAAGGYVINDIFDIEEDTINRPEKRIIAKHVSVRSGNIFYAVLLAVSLVFGFLTDWGMGFLVMAINILLYYYASDLKGSTLWGNLLVSFLNGVVVYCAARGVLLISDGYFSEYAMLAFLITLAREIVKDIEDMEGDKVRECETFPIVYGEKKANWLAIGVLSLLNVLLIYMMVETDSLWFRIFCIAAVIAPVFTFYYMLLTAWEKRDYSRIQRRLKWLMLSGILSVIFI